MIRKRIKHTAEVLQEFSIPLIAGVITALIWANVSPSSYEEFLKYPLWPHSKFTFHIFVNEIFMVFFFGVAAVEITESCLPGGDLHPLKKAINPLIAMAGGVICPVLLYIAFCFFSNSADLFRGWAIPTATDIALAWLVARFVFSSNHPAVYFLLLLAVGDDAIGLAIIAIFYPSTHQPSSFQFLILIFLGILFAFILRKQKVKSYWPYLLGPGVLSWLGLFKSGLHPALALVFIVPFMPDLSEGKKHLSEEIPDRRNVLENFKNSFTTIVDFGLFAFGVANAGVSITGVSEVTWFVLFSLIGGKILGIWGFSYVAEKFGYPLPEGMDSKDAFLVSIICSLGLTVALFVAGVAFQEPSIQGAAKMGAFLSILSVPLAFSISFIIKRTRE